MAPPGFCNRGEVRYGSIGGLEYEVSQKLTHLLQCTHTLHNFWTSTHRGEASLFPLWRCHCAGMKRVNWHIPEAAGVNVWPHMSSTRHQLTSQVSGFHSQMLWSHRATLTVCHVTLFWTCGCDWQDHPCMTIDHVTFFFFPSYVVMWLCRDVLCWFVLWNWVLFL